MNAMIGVRRICQTILVGVCGLWLVSAQSLAMASTTKLVPAPGAPVEAQFGSAVAVQGGRSVVGAPRDANGTGSGSGAAYVFEGSALPGWKLVASDAGDRFSFGRAVAMDGDVVVIGAAYAAYVFRYDPGTGGWLEEARLTGHCSEGRFGTSIAVSGSRLLIGSPLRGCLDASVEGYVFFYERDASGAWQLSGRVTRFTGSVGSYYGWSVSMEGDTAAVGAPGWGEVFIYRHTGTGWELDSRITDPIWGSARSFGRSVSLQGGRLAVGTPGDSEIRDGAGAAYAYLQTAPGNWVGEGKLLPPPTNPVQKLTGAYYGSTVGISGDRLVLGGPQADAAAQEDGAVLVFTRNGGSWAYEATLTAPGAGSYDYLGTGLDIDNGVVVAGAPGHDAVASSAGAAYLFVVDGGEPPPPPPPPGNSPPTASFTVTTDGLTAAFDATGSKDPDGSIASYAWDFGDGTFGTGAVVSRTYFAAGTYTIRLTVTDNEGAQGSTSKSVTVAEVSDIVLTATGYKVRGLQKVGLVWTGAVSQNVDIWFSSPMQSEFWGVKVDTVPNTGAYTHHIDRKRGSTYKHWVCEAGTDSCSNKTTVVFQ